MLSESALYQNRTAKCIKTGQVAVFRISKLLI